MKHKVKNIHFIGIAGSGMSGIAEVLLNLDFSVSGSDLVVNATTKRLTAFGATVYQGHAAANLGAADVVVVGSTGMNVSSGLVPATGNVYKSSSGALDLTQLATGCSSSNPVIALQLH